MEEERIRKFNGIIIATFVFLIGVNILGVIENYLADKIIWALLCAFLSGILFGVFIIIIIFRRVKIKSQFRFHPILLKEFGTYLLSEERERMLPNGADKREVTVEDLKAWAEINLTRKDG